MPTAALISVTLALSQTDNSFHCGVTTDRGLTASRGVSV